MHWYQLDIDKVLSDLNTSESGLSDPEVKRAPEASSGLIGWPKRRRSAG